MAIPRVEVQVTADTRQAEAGLQRVERGLQDVQNRAPMAQQSTARFGGALASMGNISGRTRGQIQNFSFQLQDMAVQLQAGTRASTVMAQQLPQMVGGFGAAGAAVGALIALGIPLASFLLSSANSGRNLAQIMDALAEAVENADSQFNGLSDSLSGLVAIGGQYSARAMEIAQAQREIAFHDAAAALNETADALSEEATLNDYRDAMRGVAAAQAAMTRDRNMPAALAVATERFQRAQEEAANFAAELGMTQAGAQTLVDALDALAAAQGPAAQAQAAQNAADAFLAAAGSVDQMTESERQIYAQLLQTEQAALRLQAIEQQRSAFVSDQQAELTRSANLYRTIIQYGEDSAEADRLRAQYARQEYEARLQSEGVTGQNLQTLMALYDEQVRLSDEAERTQDAVERIAGADFNSFADRVRALAQELGIAANEAQRLLDALPVGMTYGRTLSSSAGNLLPPATSDERRAAAAFARNVEALVESLQTERETLDAWYEESLAMLNRANAAELEAIGGHNEARLRLQQEYQDRLNQLRQQEQAQTLGSYSTLFGNMATIFEAGGNRLVGITKAFSIAQGLLNSYRAYTEVLADPALIGQPFLRQALAASTLAAGLAQVANIRSVSSSGGGGGAAATASAANANAAPRQNIVIDLVGETFGRNSVTALFEQINEGLRNGERIEGILVR